MRKQLRTFLSAIALVLGVAGAAQAQYTMIVNAPASVAGGVSGLVNPADGWGFGDPQTIQPVTGFCQWASPDTLAGPTGDVGNMQGKIGVCRRGSFQFGVKALRLQRAGAIAVIIVNNGAAAPGAMAAGDSGDRVNIPVIFVDGSWLNTVRPFLLNGSLNVSIGNPVGQFAFNLALQRDLVTFPNQIHIPSALVRDTGDFKFPIGGFARNIGNQAQSSVTMTATVRRVKPEPAQLFTQTRTIATIAAAGTTGDTSEGQSFGTFDLVQASGARSSYKGHYQLTYNVTSANQDANASDNTYTVDFYVGMVPNVTLAGRDSISFSKARLDTTTVTERTGRPINTISITRSGGGALKWGHYHRTGSTGGFVNAMTWAVTTNNAAATDSLGGVSIDLEVHEWADANNDGAITDAELTLLGNATRIYNNNRERGVYFTEQITDLATGNAGVQIEPRKRYLYLVNYSGTNTVFIASDEGVDYQLWFANNNNNDVVAPLFNGTAWGFFQLDQVAALRVDIHPVAGVTTQPGLNIPTNVRSLVNTGARLHVHPNPAADRVQLTVGDMGGFGKATIRVTDLAGRLVETRTETLQGTASYFFMSTAGYNNGVYNVEVITPRGRATQKLVVAH